MAKVEKLFIQPFEIEVHYKKIKNIYLKITPAGKILISAPLATPTQYLTAFVNSRFDWIENRQQEFRQKKLANVLKAGEMLLFGKPTLAKLSDDELVSILHEKIKHYYQKYWPFFAERGKRPVEIKYRLMKATWGVCRPTARTITFNKRLVHQPVEFIEYVVLHELCHLLVGNHSKDFYALVAYHLPQFRRYANSRISDELA